MTDLRILLKRYIEEGEEHFPALFRQIKPCIYFPLLKYRNFFPDSSPPDSAAVQRDGFSDLFAVLCKRNAAYKYEAVKDMVYEIWEFLEINNHLIKYYHEGRNSNGIKNGLMNIAGQRMLASIIKKEPELSRIYKRMVKILKNEAEFKDFSPNKESCWGLSVWLNPEEFHGSLEDIKELLSSISVIKRIEERRGAKKASAIISNPGLNDLMAEILEEIKKTLTAYFFIKAIGLKVYLTDRGDCQEEWTIIPQTLSAAGIGRTGPDLAGTTGRQRYGIISSSGCPAPGKRGGGRGISGGGYFLGDRWGGG